jgi:hypothetical protein
VNESGTPFQLWKSRTFNSGGATLENVSAYFIASEMISAGDGQGRREQDVLWVAECRHPSSGGAVPQSGVRFCFLAPETSLQLPSHVLRRGPSDILAHLVGRYAPESHVILKPCSWDDHLAIYGLGTSGLRENRWGTPAVYINTGAPRRGSGSVVL